MTSGRWLLAAGLAVLCGPGCGNRAAVDRPSAGGAGPPSPVAEAPATESKDSASDQVAGDLSGQVQFDVPAVKPPEGAEVKLDGSLVALVRAFREGGDAAANALVRSASLDSEEDRLRVGVIVEDEAQVASVTKRIEELGGEVTVGLGNRIFALLPVAAVELLASEDAVWSMAVPRPVASPFGAK